MQVNVTALLAVMEKENLNTSGLAKRLGISRTTAYRILNGERKKPSPEFLEGVKKGFPDYPLDFFLLCP